MTQTPDTIRRETNSSAVVSVAAFVSALVLDTLALAASGSLRQGLEIVAIVVALLGVAAGFSGLTVARLGAPRLGTAVVGLLGSLVVLVAAVAFALL